MNKIIIVSLLTVLIGCSSPSIRSKWADKNMRVMIDPDSLSASDYIAVQSALVQEDKFMVVDRASGFNAIKAEQERLHRKESDRFSDRDKWAHWGKLYGVGSIIVGHVQCFREKKFFSLQPVVKTCKQFLSLVDANTGEVIVAVDGKSESPVEANNFGGESFSQPPDWKYIVTEFVDAYPKNFKPQQYSEGIVRYQELSKEEAERQRNVRSSASVKEGQ